jgi:hypothetical protein
MLPSSGPAPARRRFLTALLALITGTALYVYPTNRASAVDLVDVTVTIMRIQVLDDPDPAPFQGNGDMFARVAFGGGPAQNNSGDQVSSHDFSPYWTFTTSIDRDATPVTTVEIEIRDDDDSPNPDDIMDIDPDDNDLGLVLSLDLNTGTWSGDGLPANAGVSVGDGDTEHSGIFEGGEQTRLWFDISLSPNGDLDGDGIPDGVERFGIRDAGGSVTTDMAALGADPCRGTIAIEIDWLDAPDHDHQPDPAAIQEAVDAFNAAPLPAVADCPYAGFPTQSSGLNLVVDVDDAITVSATEDESNWNIAKLDAQRATSFDSARQPYFFYNIWAHTHDGSSSSGVCCSAQKGFMVTLGEWAGQNGTVRDQSGTLIHELGHNIGLGHGGGDGVNYKPNYLSVMNYRYQVIGIPDWDAWAALAFDPDEIFNISTIDYSRDPLDDLDETALDENDGIGDGNAVAYWVDPGRTVRAGDARNSLDWNWSNSGLGPFQSNVTVDINGDRVCVKDGDDDTLDTTPAGDDVIQTGVITTGPDRDCDSTASGDDEQERSVGFVQPADLTGFDDWANIKFRAVMSPDAGSPGPLGVSELTFEEAEQIKADAMEAINQPPTADAGGPYVVNEGSTVMLDGTGSSDPDGDPVTYLWSPATYLDDPTSATPVYSSSDDIVDVLTLTVTDSGGLTGSDTTTVTVLNVAPTVELDETGMVSFPCGDAVLGEVDVPQDHEASAEDPGSDDLIFAWSYGSVTSYFNNGVSPDPFPSPGGTFPFAAADTATAIFTTAGVHIIEIVASDDDGGSAADSALKVVVGDAARTSGNGYWKHQYSGNGRAHLDTDTLDGYLAIINLVSGVFSEEVALITHQDAADILSPQGADKRAVATADLLVAWLHFASGGVALDAEVTIRGHEVRDFLDVISEVEAIVADPNSSRSDLLHASFLAQRIRRAD